MDELLASGLRGTRSTVPSVPPDGARTEVLHRLVGDWQLLADLSFADLVPFVPDGSGQKLVVVAQMRPTTAPTAYPDDLVGTEVDAADAPQLVAAVSEGRIVREGDPVWVADIPVREEALPVRVGSRIVAVVS